MKNRTIFCMLIAGLCVALSAPAFAAEMVVIVHKDNANTISKSTIESIYRGDLTSWPAGGAIVAFDLPESNEGRADFTGLLLGMSVAKLKASWTVKLFSGKATPPKIVGSDAEMKSAVAANRNAVGYISASSVDGSVKAVLTLR